ncbi:hypothetical protein PF0879 [Pyrococcus furiosus DSM 3638]|uniref:Uncharacterized protein n=1 Tax=Pyrococcus furiosus (strain ATCC 43587 / DSM 3638 / JCM 8422 / Vc1) TaxID=186497 RepID=Q8U2F6_PYRFU|nr:hypothetical protein PF0879 [Pyrococcus furiosus DSM 3638]
MPKRQRKRQNKRLAWDLEDIQRTTFWGTIEVFYLTSAITGILK